VLLERSSHPIIERNDLAMFRNVLGAPAEEHIGGAFDRKQSGLRSVYTFNTGFDEFTYVSLSLKGEFFCTVAGMASGLTHEKQRIMNLFLLLKARSYVLRQQARR
jgi:hypothetical protein